MSDGARSGVQGMEGRAGPHGTELEGAAQSSYFRSAKVCTLHQVLAREGTP